VVAQDEVERTWQALEADPGTTVAVDLGARTVTVADRTVTFEVDDYTRWRLMEGLDDVGLTLQHVAAIDAFEATRPTWKPSLTPAG
jgi:3-isopropylmalate/(R)-2-methylmalate dehydratase small subunit